MVTLNRRKIFRGTLIVLALLLVIFPPNIPGTPFARISAGVLFLTAGLFFFLGVTELLRDISLSRRMALAFFSVVLLWGLTGYAGSGSGIAPVSEDGERARRIRDLGHRIDNIAEVGSGQVATFVDSMFTGETGELLGTMGEVTGAATGVLINAVLTSTTVDSASLTDTTSAEGQGNESPSAGVPLIRTLIIAGALSLLAVLQGFVYTDRSRYTLWLYRTTVAMVFLSAFLHVTGVRITLSSGETLFQGIELDLPGIFLFILAVAMGFRQRWVQYLSGKSRYFLLLAAFPGVLMIRTVYYWLTGNGSPGAGGVETAAVMVSAVYILFAFVTMLLHLPTARIMEKRSRELDTLQDLSQALHTSFQLEQLCEAAVRLGVKLTDADVCLFHLGSGEDHLYCSNNSFSSIRDSLGKDWYSGVSRRIDAGGGGFMMNNYRRSTLRKQEEKAAPGSRIASILAAPVEVRGERLGILIAASSRQFFFLDYTRGLFDSFTRQIAQAIQSARLFGEKLQLRSLERELELARDIQRGLLPGRIEHPEGWEIEAASIPSRVVGGDYYDIVPLENGLIAVAIADVSGKGAAAAMLMAALQASLRTLLRQGLSVAETVSRLNGVLCERMPEDTFITFFLAFIQSSTGETEYCCAGHDPPILCRASETVFLQEGGLVLGVVPGAAYSTGRTVMEKGSRLLLYTDGVTETMTREEEPFGVERLESLVRKHCDESPGVLVDTMEELLERFRGGGDQTDDVTMVAIVRKSHAGRN